MTDWKALAQIALDIGAIRVNPDEPFTWASGYRMPVYNDNRLLLGDARHRLLIGRMMKTVIGETNIAVDCVAGTATAGIPHATTLANLLETPLVYVRASAKQHGMQNKIEGILEENQNVVVVEDLISTGGSAIQAVEALRSAGAHVEHCLCIFNYGFQSAREAFSAAHCRLHTLLTFPNLVTYAEECGRISAEQKALLDAWYQNPFEWAARQGF